MPPRRRPRGRDAFLGAAALAAAAAAGVSTGEGSPSDTGASAVETADDHSDSQSSDSGKRTIQIETHEGGEETESASERLEDLLAESFPGLELTVDGSTFHIVDPSMGEDGSAILDIVPNEAGQYTAWLSDDLQNWLEGEMDVFKRNKGGYLDGYELREKGEDVTAAISDARGLAQLQEQYEGATDFGDLLEPAIGAGTDVEDSVFYNEQDVD